MTDNLTTEKLMREFVDAACECEVRDYLISEYAERIEQAIAATPGNGTLTAEQLREAAKSNSRQYKSPIDDGIWITEYDWQAIADELNAKLRSGTCHAMLVEFEEKQE